MSQYANSSPHPAATSPGAAVDGTPVDTRVGTADGPAVIGGDSLPMTGDEVITSLAAIGISVDALPVEVDLLPELVASCLDADSRDLWPRLCSTTARSKVILRGAAARRRRVIAAQRHRERETAAARYVDALCRLPHLDAGMKEAGRRELDEARLAYHAVRAR